MSASVVLSSTPSPSSHPSVPIHPPPISDTSTQPLIFNVVGVLIGTSTIIIGGLQLRKMYVATKRMKEESSNSESPGMEQREEDAVDLELV